MTYREALQDFGKQCSFEPAVSNADKLKPYRRIIIAGMGGSRLAPDILNMLRPDLEIHVHSDFGLPRLSEEALSGALFIANSYSGNTAETIDCAETAIGKGYAVAVVTTGGKLKQLAEDHGLPIIITPEAVAARLNLGFNLAALMAMLGLDRTELKACASLPERSADGAALAGRLAGSIPLVYAPDEFTELGYIWKVIFNETGKIPAFCNRFPELDHNEIAGFDASSKELSAKFAAVILQDRMNDRLMRRAGAVSEILAGRGIPVLETDLAGNTSCERILASAILAHWTALSLAEARGADPLVEEAIKGLKEKLA